MSTCYFHAEREATAYCRTCGRALCAEDQRNIYGVIYCQECLARGAQRVAPPAAQLGAPPLWGGESGPSGGGPGEPGLGHIPSPGIALLLGFIPGVGAIYNGQYVKAFVQVVIWAFLIAMAANGDGLVQPFFGVGIAVFYFYMIIDSYRTAKQMEAGLPVSDVWSRGQAPVNAPVAAIVLIVIGGIFLLRSLGFFFYDFSRFFWPVLLIAVGVYLLLRERKTPLA